MTLKSAHELPEAGIIVEPGNAADYKTGDWRSLTPQLIEENCIHCLFCWIWCPDGAVELDTSGKKPKVVRFDLEHCKGCGICAHECPPARKGKSAVVMVREER